MESPKSEETIMFPKYPNIDQEGTKLGVVEIPWPFTSFSRALDERLKSEGFALAKREIDGDHGTFLDVTREYRSENTQNVLTHELTVFLPHYDGDEDVLKEKRFEYGNFSPDQVTWLDKTPYFTTSDCITRLTDGTHEELNLEFFMGRPDLHTVFGVKDGKLFDPRVSGCVPPGVARIISDRTGFPIEKFSKSKSALEPNEYNRGPAYPGALNIPTGIECYAQGENKILDFLVDILKHDSDNS